MSVGKIEYFVTMDMAAHTPTYLCIAPSANSGKLFCNYPMVYTRQKKYERYVSSLKYLFEDHFDRDKLKEIIDSLFMVRIEIDFDQVNNEIDFDYVGAVPIADILREDKAND